MNDFTILRSTKDEEPEQDYAVLGLRDIQIRFVTKVRIHGQQSNHAVVGTVANSCLPLFTS